MFRRLNTIPGLLKSIPNPLRIPETHVRVAMVGPRGAGKTSLLTAMYDRFGDVVGSADLAMRPEDDSVAAMLNDRMAQLLNLINDPACEGGILGDAVEHIYQFAIGRRGFGTANPSFKIAFHDYPGGWLAGFEQSDAEASGNFRKIVDIVRQAEVAQIAIDTPYLMEDDGRYHEARNRPRAVAELLRSAYSDGDSRQAEKLVIFSPVKCERYTATAKGRMELLDRVQMEYAETFDVLKRCASNRKILVAITPVQTTGCVSFQDWMQTGDTSLPVRARYQVPSGNGVYQPRDSDQPLSYIILFAMRQYKHNIASSRIHAFVSDLFKLDTHIKEGFEYLASTCKSTDGFAAMDMGTQ